MDDIRGSLSKMKKKFKHRLTGRKHESERPGANPGGEGADPTSSVLQSGPHIVVDKSFDGEGDKADVAGEPVFSTDQPPQPGGPGSVPARGSGSGQGGGAEVDGEEASQVHSHPRSVVEVAVGSGRSGELEGVHPPSSTPSISHGVKPNGT